MRFALQLLLGVFIVALPPLAAAYETQWNLKLRVAGQSESRRDLGQGVAADRNEVFLDVNPALHVLFGPESRAFARLRGFVPTGQIVEQEDDRPVRSESYAALRELWFEYGGLTDYPGEVLRIGLQRLRDIDGLWWDQDVESVRWLFDTTLLRAQFGLAQQFDSYRTDDVDVPASQKDRLYAFGTWNVQWLPGHYVGIRGTYAKDHGGLARQGARISGDDKRQERQVGWAALRIDNRYFDYRNAPRLAYWAEVVGYVGTREVLITDGTGLVTGTDRQDVRALGGEVAARYRFSPSPLQFGLAYAYGQGGRTDGTSRNFEQTGLHSNRSRFTGTRTQMGRFTEALKAELTNIHVGTGFLSYQHEVYDANLVYNRYRRDDRFSGVVMDGIDREPVTNSSELGAGLDLIFTRYFERIISSAYGWDDDTHSSLRLRLSQFDPGAAYGPGADSHYLITLEGTLWF